jgi:hypothetical protein
MPERAEDQAAMDSRVEAHAFGGGVYDLDHALGGESAVGVEERRKPEFRVDDMVGLELLKDVFGYEFQRLFVLHEDQRFWGAGQKVGEIGASRRSHVISEIFFTSDTRGKTGNRGITERAIEMQMKFEFRQIGKHSFIL